MISIIRNQHLTPTPTREYCYLIFFSSYEEQCHGVNRSLVLQCESGIKKSSISIPIVSMEDLGLIKFVSCSILVQEYRTRALTLWCHLIFELSVRSTISTERVAIQQYTIKEMYFAAQGDILQGDIFSIDWRQNLLQNRDYSSYIILVRDLLLHC